MIEWESVRPSDADELREFVCTDEPARDEHGELIHDAQLYAELEAQTGIREAIQLPLPRGEYVLVGRDPEGIAAVCWWYEVGGPARVKILVAGVALRLRGGGRHIGDEMLEQVVSRLLERADPAFHPCIAVQVLVSPYNGPSQALLSRAGFFYVQDSGNYQEWWHRIDVPE